MNFGFFYQNLNLSYRVVCLIMHTKSLQGKHEHTKSPSLSGGEGGAHSLCYGHCVATNFGSVFWVFLGDKMYFEGDKRNSLYMK